MSTTSHNTRAEYRPLMEPVQPQEIDYFRDTWARFLGYANEVGEAFRGLAPLSVVHATYGIVGIYVLADAIDKGRKASKAKWSSDKERRFAIVDKVSDTLIWQTLASLLVPPLIINRACKLTAFSLNKFFPLATTPSLTPRTRAAIQTAVGLSVIPFIVHPIDHAMHVTMDHTTRSLSSYIKNKYVVPAAVPLTTTPSSVSADQQQKEAN